MKYLMIICGALLFFGSFWFGSYFLHEFGMQDWRGFPTFMTSCFTCLAGILLFVTGASK